MMSYCMATCTTDMHASVLYQAAAYLFNTSRHVPLLLQVALSVRPLVAGRVLKHPALASHVCRWLEARLLRLTSSSLVFPAAADIALPMFQGACSPATGCSPPAAAAQPAGVAAGRAGGRQWQKPGRSSRNSSGGSSGNSSRDLASRWRDLAVAAGAPDHQAGGAVAPAAVNMQQQLAAGCDDADQDSSSLTSSSSNSSCGWAGDTADSQQRQQQQQEEGNEEEWWMGEASAQLPKSEPKQSVMGASAPMTPRERSSSARVHSCPLVDADLRRSSACETAAASITEDGWHAASGSHSAAAAAATGPHSGAGRCRVMSETADSSADERAGSGISGGERGFASALLPGKFWKKRRSKSSRQLLQVGGADPVADMAVAVQSGILAL